MRREYTLTVRSYWELNTGKKYKREPASQQNNKIESYLQCMQEIWKTIRMEAFMLWCDYDQLLAMVMLFLQMDGRYI